MSLRIAPVALAALLSVAPAGGQIVVIAPDSDREAADSRVVCKSQKATGTRLAKKSCRTVRQWDEMREQHMRDMKEATGPGVQLDSANPNAPN